MLRFRRGRSLALALFLVLPPCLLGQNPTEQQSPSTEVPQAQPASPDRAQPPLHVPEPRQEPQATAEKLEIPQRAQDFKFTKVDLELLRQVDAFDRYMEEKGLVYSDPETDAYLEELGLSLVPKQPPENVHWHFRVVRDLEVNAFALPNGSIYVNSGLVSRMENEAQIAGVLAHEITHVTNRHGYLEYRSMRKKMVAIDVFTAVGAYGGGVVAAMSNLLSVIMVSTIFGYSREMEHEADVYAVNALYLQGYDLLEFSRGFQLLRQGPEVDLSKEPVFWANHPKLADRVQYVASMAAQLQPKATALRIDGTPYRAATKDVTRHNAGLAILLGRPRTAVASARRLIEDEPSNAENFVLLGDAYRTLGARTPIPDDEELTEHGKNDARKHLQSMTFAEYDKRLFAEPHGSERWQANAAQAEDAFHKALAIDPNSATAHRGLGFLAERQAQRTPAIEEFKRYLEMAPAAKDARQVRMHIESLEKQVPSDATVPEKPKSVQ